MTDIKKEETIFDQAVECYKNKKYSEAIGYFTQVIGILEKVENKDQESQVLLANAYFNRGVNKYELENGKIKTDSP